MDTKINIALPCLKLDEDVAHLPELDESIRSLFGSQIVFTRGLNEAKPLMGWQERWGREPVEFNPQGGPLRVMAVDSSCRRIAETREGTVYAVRGALVEAEGGRVTRFRRIGPLIFHLTPSLCDRLASRTSDPPSVSRLLQIEPVVAEGFLRNRIERMIQLEAVEGGVDLLLVDGALRRSRLEDRGLDLRLLVEKALHRGTSILGLSKTSRLKVLVRSMGRVSVHGRAPCLLDVKEEMGVFGENLLGHPFIVRFSLYGDPLRVDIASRLDATWVLGSLLANDQFYAGYPESLRLAHHLCVIKSADVASIEGYLVGRLGVLPQPAVDARMPFLQPLQGGLRR